MDKLDRENQTSIDAETPTGTSDEHHCILCDVVIEVAEHDIFFVTGHCRFCHDALEQDE